MDGGYGQAAFICMADNNPQKDVIMFPIQSGFDKAIIIFVGVFHFLLLFSFSPLIPPPFPLRCSVRPKVLPQIKLGDLGEYCKLPSGRGIRDLSLIHI